jgi:hypothetical protein
MKKFQRSNLQNLSFFIAFTDFYRKAMQVAVWEVTRMTIGNNEVIALVVAGLFLITGIQLFRGQWLFLVAGYNTLSKSDKEKLNGKFIGKVVGGLLFLSSAIIGAMILYPKGKVIWFVCQILLVIIAIIYVNTSKRKLN